MKTIKTIPDAIAFVVETINAGNNSIVTTVTARCVAFRASTMGRGPIQRAAADVGCFSACEVHADVIGDNVLFFLRGER